MQFGQTDNLDSVDLSLPDDPAFTEHVLAESANSNPVNFYLDCAKWIRPDWVGSLYPPKTKPAQFLAEYVKQYNCVEMNATHYRIFDAKTIDKWRETAPEGFLYCPKFYQGISHHKRLKEAESLTEAFYTSVSALGNHLGPLFLQLHDNYKPDQRDVVLRYLEILPREIPVFLEVRNTGWFADHPENRTFFEELRKLNIGLVLTDAAGRRDVCHMHLTTPAAFIRFVGNGLHPTDYTRIDDWVERIAKWIRLGIRDIYFFMHMHDERYSPELSLYLAEKLNQTAKLNLHLPRLNHSEPDLFG